MRKIFFLWVLLCAAGEAWGQISASSSTTFCQGGSVNLTADNPPSSGATFQWQRDGVDIVGATTQFYSAMQSGTYTVIVTPVANNGSIVINVTQNATISLTSAAGTSNQNTCSFSTITAITYSIGGGGSGATVSGLPAGVNGNFNAGILTISGIPTATGTYNYTVNTTGTCSQTSTTGTITVMQGPEAKLGGPSATTYDGQSFFRQCSSASSATLNFTNQSSTTSTNTSYKIVWGDNSIDYTIPSFSTVAHTYSLGTYHIVFIVTGGNGCVTTSDYYVFIGSNPAVGLGNPGNTTICSNTPLTFPITGTASNTPGTVYKVTFNDGSPVLTYTHPAPADVTHNFLVSSCGTNSPGYNNSFSATIQATNPCQPSSATVVPIYVSEKPHTGFTISPSDVACINSTVNFINTSGTNKFVDNGSCSNGARIWSISPASGWTLTTGTLGNDFGLNDPSVWTTASQNISVKFTVAGTYTIKLKNGNPNCGMDSISKTVCINVAPVPSFTLDQTEGCVPLTVTTTNTSTGTGGCSPATYTWSVTYTNGFCGTAASWSFASGTSASSTNAAFLFNTSGTYTVTLTVTNDCGAITSTKIVSIKKVPLADFTVVTPPCPGKQLTITPAATNCGTATALTYLWNFSGGTPATSNTLNPGLVSFPTGTQNITLSVTNECGATTVSKPLIVPGIPDVTVPADQTFCNGTTAGPFTFTGSPGTLYQWSNSNTSIGLAASGFGTIGGFIAKNTGASPITATITVTPIPQTGGCNGTPKTFTITVNPGPSIADAGPDRKVCNGTTAALAATVPTVGTGTWTQVFGPIVTIANPSSASTIISGISIPDSLRFVWTVQNSTTGCPATTDTAIVITRPTVTLSAPGNDTVFCNFTAANNFLNLQGNKDTSRYWETGLWTIDPSSPKTTGSFSNPASPTAKFTFTSAGTYILTWTLKNDAGCTPSQANIKITVVDKPVAGTIAAATQNACLGSNIVLNLTGFKGSIAKWQYHRKPLTGSNWVDTAVTNGAINFNNVQDTFWVRAIVMGTDPACTAMDTTLRAVINVSPVSVGGTTGNDATVCGTSNGNTITLSGHTGTVTGWEKSINNGVTWTTVTPANTIAALIYTNLTQSTKYRAVVQSGACAAALSAVTTITVAGASAGSNAGADQLLCNATGTQLNANAPPSGSTGTWVQLPATTAVITDNALYNTTITAMPPGIYRFVWKVSNGVCAATSDTVVVTNYPPLTNTTTGTVTTLCSGQSVPLTGQAPTGGSGIYTYQWQYSTDSLNWTDLVGQTTANITYVPNKTGFVRRLVTSSTCELASNAAFITYQPGITNNTIAKDTSICPGGTVSTLTGFTPAGGNGIFGFQWQNSINGGATWTDIAGALTSNYQPAAPVVTTQYRRLVSSSVCTGTQASSSNPVTIKVNPDAKAVYTYSKDMDCAVFNLATAIQNVPSAGNGSYQWYANNVLIGSGTTMPAYAISNPFDSVVIKLKAINPFGCKNDSMEHKFYTVPRPAPSFKLSDTVGCGPLSVTINNNTPNAGLFSFKWDFGNGFISVLPSPLPIVFQPNPNHLDTIYTVTLTAFTPCDTVKTVRKVRVKAKPKALFTPDRAIGCSPFKVNFTNTSIGLNTTYKWDFGDGTTQTSSSLAGVAHIYNTGVKDTFAAKLIAMNECGNDTLVYKIVVSPNTVKLDFAVNGNEAINCSNGTVHFINNTTGATSFKWDFGDGNLLTTTKNIDTVAHVYSNPGIYTVKLVATNGCSDTTDTELVQVFARPKAGFNASPVTACLGDTIHFTNQTDTATGYAWQFGDGFTSVATNPVHSYGTASLFRVRLVAVRQYANIACRDTVFNNISILASLPGSFKVSDSIGGCVPFNVLFTNQSLPSVLTIWDFGNGKKDTGNTVQHNFTATGFFTVKMNALKAGGCTYEALKTIKVNGPTGSFSYDNGLICGSKSVRLQVNATGTDSLRFYFGDGSFLTTTSMVIFHSYTQGGNYIPSVELLSGAACRVLLAGMDTIKIDYIKAGFTASQLKTCGQTDIQFTDTSRTGRGIQQWQWNFGDGSTAGTVQHPKHRYFTAGMLPVQLIVYGKSGCNDTTTVPVAVSVYSRPNAVIQAAASGCTNQAVNYTALVTSIDSVTQKTWVLYNNIRATGNALSYTYPVTGTYTTQFITGTMNGCYDTAVNIITINQSPVITTSPDLSICKGQGVQLSAAGATNYSWFPTTNITCTSCTNPVVNPPVTTAYVASTVNNFGCIARDTVLVTVAQPFKITASPNDSICIGQSTQLFAAGATAYRWFPATGLDNALIAAPKATPALTTNYRVIGLDSYNCFTDTAYVVVGVGDYPIVKLGQDQVIAAGTQFPFTPVYSNGPMKSWHWNPASNLSCSNCETPVATAKRDICYDVRATSIYGCEGRDTLCFKVFCENTQVFIPNAFLPGTGTGVNDVLMVRGTGIKLVKSFRIYNRWGQVVFERANVIPNDRNYGWNGYIQGKLANPDVFVYTCEVACENDVIFTYKGNVAVLK